MKRDGDEEKRVNADIGVSPGCVLRECTARCVHEKMERAKRAAEAKAD